MSFVYLKAEKHCANMSQFTLTIIKFPLSKPLSKLLNAHSILKRKGGGKKRGQIRQSYNIN